MDPQRRKAMDRLMDALFDLTPDVRYVAVYRELDEATVDRRF